MSDEQLFRVAFSGVITGEFDVDTTKKQFAKLFRLDDKKIEKLFSGKEFILKDKISEEVAMNFAIRIAETGCECYIETVPDGSKRSDDSQGERRDQERRSFYRRSPRLGSATPDRRVLVGRRKNDQSTRTTRQASQ